MERAKIKIGEYEYRFTKAKEGEKSCLLCDLINYCLEPNNVGPCYNLFDGGDWYLKRIGDSLEGDE